MNNYYMPVPGQGPWDAMESERNKKPSPSILTGKSPVKQAKDTLGYVITIAGGAIMGESGVL